MFKYLCREKLSIIVNVCRNFGIHISVYYIKAPNKTFVFYFLQIKFWNVIITAGNIHVCCGYFQGTPNEYPQPQLQIRRVQVYQDNRVKFRYQDNIWDHLKVVLLVGWS